MVPGVILAAGRSSRMGRAKALLESEPGGESFVRRLVRALCEGGVQHALVVGRPEDRALREEVDRDGVAGAVRRKPGRRRRAVVVGARGARRSGWAQAPAASS